MGPFSRLIIIDPQCRMTKGPMKGTLRILGVLDILDLHCQTVPVFFVFITRREGGLVNYGGGAVPTRRTSER